MLKFEVFENTPNPQNTNIFAMNGKKIRVPECTIFENLNLH